MNIEHGGKVTSHRVKYSHHPDGRAHFSQDGRIFTAIKRQSISLDTQNGHMFTLYIQGLHALSVGKMPKDAEGISVNRSVINFQIEPTVEATALYAMTGKPARVFTEFFYQTHELEPESPGGG